MMIRQTKVINEFLSNEHSLLGTLSCYGVFRGRTGGLPARGRGLCADFDPPGMLAYGHTAVGSGGKRGHMTVTCKFERGLKSKARSTTPRTNQSCPGWDSNPLQSALTQAQQSHD